MKKIIMIVAIVAVALGVIGFVVVNNKDDKNTTTPTTATTTDSSTQSQSTTTDSANQAAADQVTITYSNDGFSPNTTTVKSGGTVTVKNTTSSEMQFNSDPHPTHTNNSELNLGSVGAGQSKSFTVAKTGSFGYHNHLNPSDTGTIVVQ